MAAVAMTTWHENMAVEAAAETRPAWADYFNDEMIDFWLGEVLWNQDMAKFTSYGVGGCAEAIIWPASVRELSLLLKGIRRLNIPWRLVGGGSNILVADEGLKGITLIFGKRFATIEVVGEKDGLVDVRVEAGCSLARLVNWCAEQGLSGLEFAAGIPGSVGGALVMNAGAWGGDISQVIRSITVMDEYGECCDKEAGQLHYGYRSWGEDAGLIAVAGVFGLQRGDKAAIKEKCRKVVAARMKQQPQEASCGSFFKNPPQGRSAGELIELAGLKGKRLGGAMVSEKHGNFLINTGSATAHDLIRLMHLVQSTVNEKFGVLLEPEVRLLGFAGGN